MTGDPQSGDEPLPVGERVALSRAVSHALRHEPWVYELELDGEGWTSLPALVEALRDRPRWRRATVERVREVVAAPGKRRFEVDGDRIRALYGHSVPGRIVKVEAVPPSVLFHGTSPEAWEAIGVQGLVAMGRQYVHLSTDVGTAVEVGRRKAATPVILRVDAAGACEAGVRFWSGNERVWLADAVPARFLAPD